MKSYPYIGRNKHDVEFLVFSETRAIVLNGVNKGDEHNPSYFIRRYKNITHEYLSNTYGEVVSPEHAEFIIELAKVNGIQTIYSSSASEAKSFEIGRRHISLYSFGIDELNLDSKKQITIPLPPKQIQTATPEEDFEMTQIMKNAGDNLVLGYEQDFKVARAIIDELREKVNCSDELLASCDEWPQVGDEVLVYPNSRRNMEIRDKVVKVIGKCLHSDGSTIITVEHSSLGVFAVAKGSWIQKPKTPDEELRDDLFSCKKPNLDTLQSEDLAEWLIANYEMKKKPQ